MNNYKIIFNFTDVEHSDIDMDKIMSNMIAFNGTLYSLDYHGFENGSGWGIEDGIYKLIVIVNGDVEDYWFETPDEIISDVEEEIKRRGYRINKWNVEITRSHKRIEIPEGYIDQYYANSYFDIEGVDM